MSFWEDASTITKVMIVVGIIGIIGFGYMLIAEPGGGDEPTSGERGLQPAGAAQ